MGSEIMDGAQLARLSTGPKALSLIKQATIVKKTAKTKKYQSLKV